MHLKSLATLKPIALLLAPVLALGSGVASAAAYRWVDAAGGVHYSQTPPDDRPSRLISSSELPAPAAAPASGAVSTPAQASKPSEASEFLRRAAEADAQKRKQADAERKSKAANVEQCTAARGQLRFLDEHPPNRLMHRDPGDEPHRVTSDEWDQKRAEAAKLIAERCR